ncbi:MAG: hypothetical protein HOE95_03590 [Flavobacteriales bacterium]|jgi:hypothetical protein|nr:hypothetical protein [Flavobacteriales bacterium]MBT5131765.1 hypothetical protein [Flavobacteriales bacterium]MBT6132021.1 hypothetical protein [Flavobacteriales bacterium]MBT6381983.1 hypothetical protein [Flavobacteriales bacterium]MBT7688527.1 hypothetical protein [Flavobacteriales bacterium]
MVIIRILISIILISSGFILRADDDAEVSLRSKLKQLVVLREAVLKAETDEERLETNAEFLLFLRDALNHEESFKTNFDTIPKIGDLRSPDGYFRMLSWNIPLEDETNKYHCFIQYYDRKEKEYKLVELKKSYHKLKGETRRVFNEKDWYGALYYKIIPAKYKKGNRKRHYILLGWDGHNRYSSMKVIDVMIISPRGIRFGADLFDHPEDRNIKRFILEYQSDAAVSLKYDKHKKRIIFNQLVPSQPDLEGMQEFYIPLLEFDAFEWKKRKWRFVHDLDVRMDVREKPYNFPPEEQNSN